MTQNTNKEREGQGHRSDGLGTLVFLRQMFARHLQSVVDVQEVVGVHPGVVYHFAGNGADPPIRQLVALVNLGDVANQPRGTSASQNRQVGGDGGGGGAYGLMIGGGVHALTPQ